MICKVHIKDIEDWYILIQVEYLIVKQDCVELQHAFDSKLNIVILNKDINKIHSDTVQVVISVSQEYYNKITEMLRGNNQLFEKVGNDHTPVANVQSSVANIQNSVTIRNNISMDPNLISFIGTRIGFYDLPEHSGLPVFGYKYIVDEPDKVMVYIMSFSNIVPYWIYGDRNKLRLHSA